ncbi:MAG: response regulator [Candidatus Heimdallarchaeota archaeon]|nr:response regulator [Candidatus Heimdallarchaeota archaeon]
MKILIVDDNKELRTIFKLMLKEFEIDEAENGLKALELSNKNEYNLILMDILMPEMDGIVATKEILKLNPSIVILAVTAYFSRAEEILLAGAKEVLKKPIRKNVLIEKIHQYIKS